ncbi:hypothetical protein BDV96DRAFT_605848 [Lophiotrema nucula]|uniref:Uncharacterized protein n=1 Tax=Lophiotrema nucula TaxID=690887 RepID=A0A6A5YP42_9PLEO|nr:hypothetical protein BDV96DRAFT_605848 [Lophiotrema nucula]
MKMFPISRKIILFVLHTSGFIVASQDVPLQSHPPYPIPANSSTIVPPGTGTGVFPSPVPSTTLTGTGPHSASSTEITGVPSPGTSTDPLSSVDTILTPTESIEISSSSDLSTTSGVTSSGDTAISTSPTATITDGPSSTASVVQPPEVTITSSSTDGIILPPGITLPPDPSTTFLPTGTEIQSSASDVSSIIAGIFPLLQNWIDDPKPPQVTGVTNELDNILPKASGFLGKLPKPSDGVEPCKSRKRGQAEEAYQDFQTLNRRSFLGGLFKTAFSLVTCVIDGANKIKDGVIDGATDSVKTLVKDLEPMVDALNEVDPNESDPSATDSNQPTSTQGGSSTSSSSSSCSMNTVSNCNVACTAVATTTVGGARRRAGNDACTTTCDATITKCGVTGVTSASTVTSTTTASRKCAKGCSACNAPLPLPEPITGGDYLTDTNGLAYVAASTASVLPTDVDVAARDTSPKETGIPNRSLYKRALTNPRDREFNGDVGEWLLAMVKQPGIKDLAHGNYPGWFSTSITEKLLNNRAVWRLGNMHGCTAIIVISRKRMFMAHIWESPTMDNADGDFQRDAIDVLRDAAGDGKGVTEGLSAFTGSGGDFENIAENRVRAMIITPMRRESSDPQPNDLEYPNQVNSITQMLRSTLGLPWMIPVNTVAYEDRGEEEEWKEPHGKILIQYDPVQAMQQGTGQSCQTQIARLEVWYEETLSVPRFEDEWTALADQTVAIQPGPSRRLIRGRLVTDADEEEWQQYASLLRRQDGVCVRPSSTPSASSNIQAPTTLQTSILSSSGGGGSTDTSPTTDAPIPTTTTGTRPTTTEEPQTSSDVPEPTPAPSPPPSKAVSIVLHAIKDKFVIPPADYNSWLFYETDVGVVTDPCNFNETLDDKNTRWTDHNAINEPPWPHGTFTMTLHGEDNCQYLDDGNSVGVLHCPSFGDGNMVSCKEDPEKSQASAIIICQYDTGDFAETVHRVAFCEW